MMGGQNQPGFSGYPMLNPMQVHGQMPQGPMPQGRVQPPHHILGQAGESQGPVPPGQILGQMPSGQNMTANSMYQGPAQQVQGYSGQRMEQNQMRMMHHSQRAMHEQQQMGAQLGVQHSSAGYAQLNTTNVRPLTPTLMPYIQNGGHGGTYGMQYSPHSQLVSGGGGMVLGNETVAGSSINSYEQGTNMPGNVDRRSGGNDEITGMGHGQNEVGDGNMMAGVDRNRRGGGDNGMGQTYGQNGVGDGSMMAGVDRNRRGGENNGMGQTYGQNDGGMMAGGTGDVDRNRRGGENNGMGQTYGQNDGGMMVGGTGVGVVAGPGSGASLMGPPARPLSRTISPPNGDGAYMKESRQISDDVDSDKTV